MPLEVCMHLSRKQPEARLPWSSVSSPRGMSVTESESAIYKVVVNHEDQYSIWLSDRESPQGWRDAGRQGSKAECLAYIAEVWTDMRPLSLRQGIDAK